MSRGDRVVVTDLRSGQQHAGKVVAARPDPADGVLKFVNVKYDFGPTVRVGVGFVRQVVAGSAIETLLDECCEHCLNGSPAWVAALAELEDELRWLREERDGWKRLAREAGVVLDHELDAALRRIRGDTA